MESNDLATLKAALLEHAAAAEETDAVEHARMLLGRLVAERKAAKKGRAKGPNAKADGADGVDGPQPIETAGTESAPGEAVAAGAEPVETEAEAAFA